MALVTEILLLAAEDGKFSGSTMIVILVGSVLLWLALGGGKPRR
jgi:hypothetical protein